MMRLYILLEYLNFKINSFAFIFEFKTKVLYLISLLIYRHTCTYLGPLSISTKKPKNLKKYEFNIYLIVIFLLSLFLV